MNEKEKARELVESFYIPNELTKWSVAKQCALIAVDLMLNEYKELNERPEKLNHFVKRPEYWRFPQNVKEHISPKIVTGGYAITFGWNSQGFGKKQGFELIEVLLVPHGRGHNDTIVTVEIKVEC